jgi:hypothetical protein
VLLAAARKKDVAGEKNMESQTSGGTTAKLISACAIAVAVAFVAVAAAQSDPTKCPQGWQSALATVHLSKTGQSGGNYQIKTISVDVPASDVVMDIKQDLKHPKFCWKESSSSTWQCVHSDPWKGSWFRFDQFRPDHASSKGEAYKAYSVVAQNESEDRDRDARLVICHR